MASSPELLTTVDKPLRSLSRDAYTKVCFNLIVCQGLGGRNWNGFAGRIGFDTSQIMAMRQHEEQNKGKLLLTVWEELDKSGATVKKLIIALESLKMRDCIDALREDPSILDEHIELAQNECEQLIRTRKLDSQFSYYSTVEFSDALYSPSHPYPYHYHHQHHTPRDPEPLKFQPVADPVIDEPCVTEEMSQSANDVQPHSAGESHLQPKSVFLSYCPECGDAGQKQLRQLKELTNYLREHGYTVYYDKYYSIDIQQCGGINLWKEAHIRKSETILVICTPDYYQDDEKALMEGERSKIEVDRKMLRSIAFSNRCDRLVPVLLDEYKNVRNCIPMFVQPFTLHFWPSKKKDLMHCIARIPKFQLPEIPAHEKREVKSIIIPVPPRKEPKPVQIQPVEVKGQKSKNVCPHERKVLKPAVIQVPRRNEVPKSIQAQPHGIKSKKGFFRSFSRLKKVKS